MNEPKQQEDQWDIFSKFVANEIRNLANPQQQHQLKREIQKTILNFCEKVGTSIISIHFNLV